MKSQNEELLREQEKDYVCFQRQGVCQLYKREGEGQAQNNGSTNRKASVQMTRDEDDRFIQDQSAPAIVFFMTTNKKCVAPKVS